MNPSPEMTHPTSTDASTDSVRLATQARGGDTAAFATLVDKYKDFVCALAYSIVPDRGLSEDIAQKTFVQLWQHLSTIEKLETLPAWIRTTTQRLSLNLKRDRKLSRFESFDDAADDWPDAASPTPFEALEQKERDELVARALFALPEDVREPLILYYREGASVSRVAEWLEISIDNAKQRLMRGRNRLRASLEPILASELAQSRPGKAFTVAVIASIAAMTAAHTQAAGRNEVSSKLRQSGSWKLTALLALASVVAATVAGVVWLDDDHANTSQPVVSKVAMSADEVGTTSPNAAKDSKSVYWYNAQYPLDGFVLDAEGEPVSGATVTIPQSPPYVTESDGYFLFENVPAGSIEIAASSQTGTIQSNVTLDRERAPVMLTLAEVTNIRLQAVDVLTGKPIAGAVVTARSAGDFAKSSSRKTDRDGWAIFPVARNTVVVITASGYAQTARFFMVPKGRVTERRIGLTAGGQLFGKVQDEAGRPVKAAKIDLAAASGDGASASVSVETDAEGRFELPWMKAGEYQVFADHPTLIQKDARQVSLQVGRNDCGTITLSPGFILRGNVREPDGKPSVGATISAVTNDSEQFWYAAARSPKTARSDAQGNFELNGLSTLNVTLRARRGPLLSDEMTVGGRSAPMLLLQDSAIEGRVVDDTGQAASGIEVIATGESTSFRDITGEHGEFSFHGLGDDTYRITTSAHEGQLGQPLSFDVGQKDVVLTLPSLGAVKGSLRSNDGTAIENCELRMSWFEQGLNFTDGNRRIGSDFAVKAPTSNKFAQFLCDGFVGKNVSLELHTGQTSDLGTVILDPGRELRGRVLTQNGQPVIFAQVTASAGKQSYHFDYIDDFNAIGSGSASTFSDRNGIFMLRGVPPSATVLSAHHMVWGQASALNLSEVDAGKELLLVMSDHSTLRGTVISNGQPLPFVNLTFESAQAKVKAETDKRGAYQIALPLGRYDVSMIAGLLGAKQKLGEVRVSGDAVKDFNLAPTAELWILTEREYVNQAVMVIAGEQSFTSMFTMDESTEVAASIVEKISGEPVQNHSYGAHLIGLVPGLHTVCSLDTRNVPDILPGVCRTIVLSAGQPNYLTLP